MAEGMLLRARVSRQTRLKLPVPAPRKPSGQAATHAPLWRYCEFLQRTQEPDSPFQLQVWQLASVAAQVQPTAVVLVVLPMQSSSTVCSLVSSGWHSRWKAPLPTPVYPVGQASTQRPARRKRWFLQMEQPLSAPFQPQVWQFLLQRHWVAA